VQEAGRLLARCVKAGSNLADLAELPDTVRAALSVKAVLQAKREPGSPGEEPLAKALELATQHTRQLRTSWKERQAADEGCYTRALQA